MVAHNEKRHHNRIFLSVLALSSRFDGHPSGLLREVRVRSFSTRSVESF